MIVLNKGDRIKPSRGFNVVGINIKTDGAYITPHEGNGWWLTDGDRRYGLLREPTEQDIERK